METDSQRNTKPSSDPLSKVDASVFCFILKGNKHTNRVWAHPIKGPHPSATKRKLSLYTCGIFGTANFENGNESGKFPSVCALNVKLWSRLFVLLRMSFLKGKEMSAHRLAVSLPMRNRFLLTQLFGDYVMERTTVIYCKHWRTDTLVIKHLGLNIFTKHPHDLFIQMSWGLVIWIDFHCEYRLLMTHKHRTEKHSSDWLIRPQALRKGLINIIFLL